MGFFDLSVAVAGPGKPNFARKTLVNSNYSTELIMTPPPPPPVPVSGSGMSSLACGENNHGISFIISSLRAFHNSQGTRRLTI